ncbi:MAG: hypothetical protein H0V92_09855 [Pseudonocardiales bacterium]|nr:hypothetical protein [Pseudonocardiales bacterium]
MLAIAAAVIALLAALNVSLGEFGPLRLLCLAVALVALHLAFPLPVPGRRR